jgi:IS5 family transposase
MIKTNIQMSFSQPYVEKRTRKGTFLKQINQIVEWQPIEKEINKVYKRGQSVDGRQAYAGLLIFKMLLLGIWYNMSDVEVEDHVRDSLSANSFCGLQLEDDVPDHSTLSRFRTEMVAKKAFDRLLRKMNDQLKAKKLMVKTGIAMIDATITESPRVPDERPTYEIASDRKEDEREESEKQKEEDQMKLVRKKQPGVDEQARYLKKGKRLYFGYKKQIAVEEQGLIKAVHTSAANEHDSKGFVPLLDQLEDEELKEGAFTDKGYQVPDNVAYLKKRKVKNRIQHKAYRNRPLTEWEITFNKLISKKRYKVERTFGGMVRWFGCGHARYVGLAKTHAQHVLEAIAYNLYRLPGIIVSE